MKHPQSPQHRKELRGLPHLLAQLSRPGVDSFYLWSTPSFGGLQWSAQGNLQGEFLLGSPWGVRLDLEQLQPLDEVADRLCMGRALACSLSSPLPKRNGLHDKARLRVVMRQ